MPNALHISSHIDLQGRLVVDIFHGEEHA